MNHPINIHIHIEFKEKQHPKKERFFERWNKNFKQFLEEEKKR